MSNLTVMNCRSGQKQATKIREDRPGCIERLRLVSVQIHRMWRALQDSFGQWLGRQALKSDTPRPNPAFSIARCTSVGKHLTSQHQGLLWGLEKGWLAKGVSSFVQCKTYTDMGGCPA